MLDVTAADTSIWYHGCSKRRAEEVAEHGGFPADYRPTTNAYGSGLYLTSSPRTGNNYGDMVTRQQGRPGAMLKVRATPSKVFEAKSTDFQQRLSDLAGTTKIREGDEITALLKQHGYDAMLVHFHTEDWMILFDPTDAHYVGHVDSVPRLQFAAAYDLPENLTFEYVPDRGPAGRAVVGPGAMLLAKVNGFEIGGLSWFTSFVAGPMGHQAGQVEGIYVLDDYQRRGIATEMWRRAREIEPRLHHSHSLTEDGRAWSQVTAAYGPDLIARGLNLTVQSESMGRRIANGTVTAQNFVNALNATTPGHIGDWWGIMGTFGDIEDFEVYAYGGGDPYFEVKGTMEAMEQEGEPWHAAECQVVLVAKRPMIDGRLWDPDIHNPADALMGNSYLPHGQALELVEIRYDGGWGWKTLNASGIRTHAVHWSHGQTEGSSSAGSAAPAGRHRRLRHALRGPGGRGRALARSRAVVEARRRVASLTPPHLSGPAARRWRSYSTQVQEQISAAVHDLEDGEIKPDLKTRDLRGFYTIPFGGSVTNSGNRVVLTRSRDHWVVVGLVFNHDYDQISDDILAWVAAVKRQQKRSSLPSSLYWRTQDKSRTFSAEDAKSRGIFGPGKSYNPRLGYSCLDNPWDLWVYVLSFGWMQPKFIDGDDIIAFSGEKKRSKGNDGEPLVVPDMQTVKRYTWPQFEAELLKTPRPSRPGGPGSNKAMYLESWGAVANAASNLVKTSPVAAMLWEEQAKAAGVPEDQIKRMLGKTSATEPQWLINGKPYSDGVWIEVDPDVWYRGAARGEVPSRLVVRRQGDRWAWQAQVLTFIGAPHEDTGWQKPGSPKGVAKTLEDAKARAEKSLTKDHEFFQRYNDRQRAKMSSTEAPDEHWRPTTVMYGLTQDHLDPRVFTGDHMKPEVRAYGLKTLDDFWRPKYGDWTQWAILYLAGSGASYWWAGDTDLDFLIGVDLEKLRAARPANRDVSDQDIIDHLNAGLISDLRPLTPPYQPIANMNPMDVTYFVNPGSYDIRDIHPYAAYDVSSDQWVVRGPQVDEAEEANLIPDSVWRMCEAAAREAEQILTLPEPDRTDAGVKMFDWVHEGRQVAYSVHGQGWLDPGNVIYRYLEQHPRHLLRALYLCKHPELATQADVDDGAATHLTPVTASGGGTIWRGLRIPITPQIAKCFEEYTDRAQASERRAWKIGTLVLDAMSNHSGQFSRGVGIHWSTRKEQARGSAENSGVDPSGVRSGGGMPVIVEATYSGSDVVPEGDPLYGDSGVWSDSATEAEVLIKPGARLHVTGVWIPVRSDNSQVISVDGCPKMNFGGDTYANVLASPQQRTAGKYDPIEREVVLDGQKFVLTYDPIRPITQGGSRSIRAGVGSATGPEAGYLTWYADDSVADIGTHVKWQRRGLATAMWNLAKEINPDLHHSHARTPDGLAWSATVAMLFLGDVVDYKADRPLTGADARPIPSLMQGTSMVDYNRVPFADDLDAAMGTDRNTSDIGAYMAARKAWWRDRPVTQVSLHTPFVVTQANVNMPRVQQMIEHPETAGSEPIWMIRDGGRLYTLNGHHRLVADYLQGKSTIAAKVVDASRLKRQRAAAIDPDRQGKCYPLAYEYLMDQPDDDAVLVHGKVTTGIGHAWVESKGTVYDPVLDMTFPKEVYYRDHEQGGAGAKPERTYTIDQAQAAANDHYGPWHEAMLTR